MECFKGKPVVLFASAWYQNFPYVYFVDDVNVMSLVNGDVVVNDDEINDFYNRYLLSTYPGTSNLVVVHALDISMQENISAISQSINDKLIQWHL